MLEGKVAIVSGGAQGIGEAVARTLAGLRAKVAVVGFSDRARVETIVRGIRANGSDAFGYVSDIRDPDAVSKLMSDVTSECGPIDILVNTAAVYLATPVGETRAADANRVIDTNVKGTWNLINAVVPGMKTRRFGKIVTFASAAGMMGVGGYAVYCMSKAAVMMMTRALAIELAPFGININCLAPGPTATSMNVDLRTRIEMKPALEEMLSKIPSGRGFSSVEDMAHIVAFLVSESARAMHGSCVLADEGFSAGR
jgi:3-oxoacyl-[acyl-carrier protein] reductase